jgi:hypothetical protein
MNSNPSEEWSEMRNEMSIRGLGKIPVHFICKRILWRLRVEARGSQGAL